MPQPIPFVCLGQLSQPWFSPGNPGRWKGGSLGREGSGVDTCSSRWSGMGWQGGVLHRVLPTGEPAAPVMSPCTMCQEKPLPCYLPLTANGEPANGGTHSAQSLPRTWKIQFRGFQSCGRWGLSRQPLPLPRTQAQLILFTVPPPPTASWRKYRKVCPEPPSLRGCSFSLMSLHVLL